MFAVGDVRSGSAKRVAAAVGEGAMAIRLAFERARCRPRAALTQRGSSDASDGLHQVRALLPRGAGSVDVDRDDVKRYLDFVNDALYDLLIMAQATAKANVRDVIEPWDLPITKGLQESMHALRAARRGHRARAHPRGSGRPPAARHGAGRDTQARLPLIFGGISVALARTFRLIDPELKAVHTVEWDRAFQLFRLLI